MTTASRECEFCGELFTVTEAQEVVIDGRYYDICPTCGSENPSYGRIDFDFVAEDFCKNNHKNKNSGIIL